MQTEDSSWVMCHQIQNPKAIHSMRHTKEGEKTNWLYLSLYPASLQVQFVAQMYKANN